MQWEVRGGSMKQPCRMQRGTHTCFSASVSGFLVTGFAFRAALTLEHALSARGFRGVPMISKGIDTGGVNVPQLSLA